MRQEVKARALAEAVEAKRLDMVQVLVEHGARIRSGPGIRAGGPLAATARGAWNQNFYASLIWRPR
jgi:hypothetical protein